MRAILFFLMACGGTETVPSPEVPAEPTEVAPAPTPPPAPVATLPADAIAAPWGHGLPANWTATPPSSSMRLAQFSLPGDAGAADLVIYYFNGGGGGVQANFARWAGQMRVPGYDDPVNAARLGELTRDGYIFHSIDLSGDYIAETSPGSGVHVDEAKFRLIGTIIEGAGGPWFVKLTGPKATVDAHADAHATWMAGLPIGKSSSPH